MESSKNIKLYQFQFASPIGTLVGVVDDNSLLFLDFEDYPMLNKKLQHFADRLLLGENKYAAKVKEQLSGYFSGNLKKFLLNIKPRGTEFQKKIWQSLQEINYGDKSVYKNIARNINQPNSCRAVANAIGANNIVIITPCHRVIRSDNKLGGFKNGIERKKWLLQHEQNHQVTAR